MSQLPSNVQKIPFPSQNMVPLMATRVNARPLIEDVVQTTYQDVSPNVRYQDQYSNPESHNNVQEVQHGFSIQSNLQATRQLHVQDSVGVQQTYVQPNFSQHQQLMQAPIYHQPALAQQSHLSQQAVCAVPAFVNPCPSNLISPTLRVFPVNAALRAKSNLPLGLVIQPLAFTDETIQVVNFGESGVIRCTDCRSYINPYVVFPLNDRGSRWRCNVCHLINELPQSYFAPLDMNGFRVDACQRPELSQGVYDIIAPAEYAKRAPPPPTFLFIIDVSKSAIESKSVLYTAATIRQCLPHLMSNPRTQIAFMTVDSRIHFYNLRASLKAPQMLVISEIDEFFLPSPDDLLVNLNDSFHLV